MSTVPWCPECDRFYKPGSLAPDGTCMGCGEFIASAEDEDEPTEDDGAGRAPWHFSLLIVALVIYLGYRLIQGLVGLYHWIT